MKKYLSVSEVAQKLSVSKTTVYRMIREGNLPAEKINTQYNILLDTLKSRLQEKSENNSLLNNTNDLKEEEIRDQKPLFKRREFLKSTLSLLFFPAVTGLAGNVLGNIIYNRFANEVDAKKKIERDNAERNELVNSIFGGLNSISWSAGLDHLVESYNLNNFEKASNILASISFGTALNFQVPNWIDFTTKTDNLPTNVFLDGDIIAIGSPTSDEVALKVFDFSGERYSLIKNKNSIIELPINFILNKEAIDYPNSFGKRFVAGVEKKMPNWPITIEGELLFPKTTNEGWLMTDYLLITRVPNILSKRSIVLGREIISIAGTHGVGTEAIGLVLNDLNLLKILNKNITSRYFQILIPVLSIEHFEDRNTLKSEGKRLGEPIIREVKIDYEKIIDLKL
ncbi:MAG: helix-turn-helix domain-containing protein [Bacteroidales bacterium]|nr:helix-turn-helix domain-containing protein [Bacteroidales bacterium]